MTFYLLIFALINFLLLIVFLFLYVKQNRSAKNLARLRNDFMAMMIHELRSPLTIIRSSADMIIKESEALGEEQVIQLLQSIEDSSTGLLAIVNDLLDVSKIEAGKFELFRTKTDFKKLMESEVHSYQNLAKNKNIELALDMPREPVEVNCDPEKLKQVMNNLLSNAIKFTQDGGTINTKLLKFSEYVQVSVSDTGIGIPEDLKGKLFSKFIQARNLPVSREKGTGLGLVIVKGIVESHGGKVWIEDNEPKGTRIVYTLPSE